MIPLAAVPAPSFDIERVLASIDTMAAQKPVAAQIVSVANADDTSSKKLANILATDVALAGRVMKLANSAYFGMRGRVTSLQFAVTVVGFTTVRTMATVALTDLDDESRLPEYFWDLTTTIALASSTLAPRFGERPQDALCIGLLAQLGMALLAHNDAEGHAGLRAENTAFADLRAAEVQRYGISALRLTAVALEQWGFPREMVSVLNKVEEITAPEGSLLRAAFEVAGRMTMERYEPIPVSRLTCGVLGEEDLAPVLQRVWVEAEELRAAMLG